MAEGAAQGRAAEIQGFAARLRELRASAGTPSFRELAGRSRAISHTTLHEAAQGNRLPSWSTTVEFVKACGGDPAAFRSAWERANRAVLDASHGHESAVEREPERRPAVEPPAVEPPAVEIPAVEIPVVEIPVGDPPADAEPAPTVRLWRRRPRALAAAGAVVVAAAVVATVAATTGSDDAPAADPASGIPAHPTAADCPLHLPSPPSHLPLHPGDASSYVGDVTFNDCSVLATDQTVDKVWRIKNAGHVHWRGYSLHRVDVDPVVAGCSTAGIVPVADTAPGQAVDVTVRVTTPDKPAYCFALFKMYDGQGRLAFSGARGINFQFLVK